jgi:hypothetical protein
MKRKPYSRRKRYHHKIRLASADLEHAKAAVLTSLTSPDAQRGYRHAIDEFVDWYCSEPRLALNRIVVLRYRSHLESRQLAPGTINLRLGAVRRLAYEAADCGLLSTDLAAGIRRVKGVKQLGVRLGNWLTAEQGQALWQTPDHQRLKGKRDRALLALLQTPKVIQTAKCHSSRQVITTYYNSAPATVTPLQANWGAALGSFLQTELLLSIRMVSPNALLAHPAPIPLALG